MAHGKLKYLYYLDGYGYFFVPLQANRVNDGIDVTRLDYYTLRIQVVKSTDFALQDDLSAPDSATVDWSNYSDCITAIKTAANYANGGDFTAAWSGFDTGDTEWIDTAHGRFSIAIALISTINPDDYLCEMEFIDGSSTNRIPDLPLPFTGVRELITGSEPTPPSGISGNSGTATILAGNDSVVVSFTGMTATGFVIPSWLGSPQSTLSAICGTNQFTIQAGGPVASDTIVGWFCAKTS